eukprot:scaffold37771_cov169-Skeletonema_marinoi.AAC.4
MNLKGTVTKPSPTEWIHLQSGKEFSRLLYTNPVCLLATTNSHPFKNADGDSDRKVSSEKNDLQTQPPHNNRVRNVMVLSWLTASNNNGRRIDESDESSGGGNCIYEAGVEFSLSVPVKGMEEMFLSRLKICTLT